MLVYLVFFLGAGSSLAANTPIYFENVTILVSSCDKYQELWKPFYTLLFKAWPSLKTYNSHIPIVMIGNKKTYDDPRIKMVLTGEDKSWSDNMLLALKEIKTDYVLVILEDYYFDKPVNEARLKEVFLGMQKAKAVYLQIACPCMKKEMLGENYPGLKGVNIRPKHSQYRTTLQAAIWSKKTLEWLLKSGESAWDFEIPGSIRSEGIIEPFLVVIEDTPFSYLNGAQDGYWNHKALEFIRAQGIEMKNLKLPIDEEHKAHLWYKRSVLPFLYWDIYLPFKKWFHKATKKVGIT